MLLTAELSKKIAGKRETKIFFFTTTLEGLEKKPEPRIELSKIITEKKEMMMTKLEWRSPFNSLEAIKDESTDLFCWRWSSRKNLLVRWKADFFFTTTLEGFGKSQTLKLNSRKLFEK